MKKLIFFLLITNGLRAQEKQLDSLIAVAQQEVAVLSARYDSISNLYDSAENKDSLQLLMDQVHQQLSAYDHRVQDIKLHFIATHPDSPTSGRQLLYFVHAIPLDTLQQLYAGLSPAVRNSPDGKEIARQIKILKAAMIGSVAPGFTKPDINGKQLKLSDLRGQYVLLEFWASWCIPCRKTNPHLLSLYNTYKDKGFTIVGISDDERDQKAWRQAVKKDKIGSWHHILQEKKADLHIQYAIPSLPYKILLDKNGVIIGRYGAEEEAGFEKQLSSLF